MDIHKWHKRKGLHFSRLPLGFMQDESISGEAKLVFTMMLPLGMPLGTVFRDIDTIEQLRLPYEPKTVKIALRELAQLGYLSELYAHMDTSRPDTAYRQYAWVWDPEKDKGQALDWSGLEGLVERAAEEAEGDPDFIAYIMPAKDEEQSGQGGQSRPAIARDRDLFSI